MSDIVTLTPSPAQEVELEVTPAPVRTLTMIGVGPPGPPGEQGPAGPAGDLNMVYEQMTLATTWTIAHTLGKYPSVVAVDSGGNEMVAAISYPNAPTSPTPVVLTFSTAVSGFAYLN